MDGAEVDALDVDGVDLVELVFAHLQHGAVAVRPACVVHHHIELAKQALGLGHHGLDLGRLGHVRLEERCLAACGGDLCHHTLAARGVDVIDQHLGTFLRQTFGNAFANAVAGAGDDDGFVLHAHGCLLCVCSVFDSCLRLMDKR